MRVLAAAMPPGHCVWKIQERHLIASACCTSAGGASPDQKATCRTSLSCIQAPSHAMGTLARISPSPCNADHYRFGEVAPHAAVMELAEGQSSTHPQRLTSRSSQLHSITSSVLSFVVSIGQSHHVQFADSNVHILLHSVDPLAAMSTKRDSRRVAQAAFTCHQ